MQTLGIISNPYNRASRRDPQLHAKLDRALGQRGILRVTKTLEELAATVAEFQRLGISQIAVVGGDGSINLLLENLLKFYGENALPQVLLLRGGTANVLALNLGIQGSPARVLREFLTPGRDLGPNEILVQSLRVNGRIGFQFANGAAARFLQAFYRNKGSVANAGALLVRSALAALSPNVQRFVSLESLSHAVDMKLRTEPPLTWPENKIPEKLSAIFVSTIPKMALGIPLFSALKLGHTRADILATSLEDRQLAAVVLRAVARQPLNHPYAPMGTISHVHIKTKKGEPYTIDGELFDAPDEGVTIELGPRFRFCLPK